LRSEVSGFIIKVEGHYSNVLLATVAVKRAGKEMQEQLKARLRHWGLQLGLLANFNSTVLQIIPVRLPTRGNLASDSL
jgi:hypothetical protein